jgi:hypothetical protein
VDFWFQLVNAEDGGEALIVVHRVWKRVAAVWVCLTIVFIGSFFLPGVLLSFLVHVATHHPTQNESTHSIFHNLLLPTIHNQFRQNDSISIST